MSDSEPESRESTQPLNDRADSPYAPSPPNLRESDSEMDDDASFPENEDREESEALQTNANQEDVIIPVNLPPAGIIPVNTTSPGGIASPATSPPIEAMLANVNTSLENINGLLKGVLEMVITQNMQTGMMMHEILQALLHQMPDEVLDTRGKIRIKLGNGNFNKFQKDTECDFAMRRLRFAGSPWNMVTDIRAVGDNTLLLTVVDEVWEDKIRLEVGRFGSILELDPGFIVKSKRYCVEIVGYYASRHNQDPRSQKGTWSQWNGVTITDVFRRCNALVLSMESRKDAEKLWKGSGVIVDGSPRLRKVTPVDLRAYDLWCNRCNKPSHLQNECNNQVQCECKNSEVVKMLRLCAKWRKAGPSWTRDVQQPQLPDELLLNKLRAYRNTPAGRAFLDAYKPDPEPRQFVGHQASANAGATTVTQPAPKPTTNATKRKRDWDSHNVAKEDPPSFLKYSQQNQRKLDEANGGHGSGRRGRGRPRGGSERNNASKRRRGN
nr:hypothetical protein FVER53263_12341 [Fusarium verticillioides]